MTPKIYRYKNLILVSLFLTNHAFAGWISASDNYAKMSINEDSIKLQNDIMLFWVKINYFKPKMIEGNIVDEVYTLQNINCDIKAYKYDEGVLKRNGKEVWRLTQNTNFSYMYPEPDSSMEKIVNNVCKLAEIFKEERVTTMTEFKKLYSQK